MPQRRRTRILVAACVCVRVASLWTSLSSSKVCQNCLKTYSLVSLAPPLGSSSFSHVLPVLISNWAFIARHPSDVKATASLACPPITATGSSCQNVLASFEPYGCHATKGRAGRLQATGTRTHRECTWFASLSPARSQGCCFENFPFPLVLAILHRQRKHKLGAARKKTSGETLKASHRSRLLECRTLSATIFGHALFRNVVHNSLPRRHQFQGVITSLIFEKGVKAPVNILNTQALVENQIKDFRENAHTHYFGCLAVPTLSGNAILLIVTHLSLSAPLITSPHVFGTAIRETVHRLPSTIILVRRRR